MGLFGGKKELRTFAFIAKNAGASGETSNRGAYGVFDDLDAEYRTVENEYYAQMGRQLHATAGKKPERKFWPAYISTGKMTPFFPNEWGMGLNFPRNPGWDTNFRVDAEIKDALKKQFKVGIGVNVTIPGETSPLGNYTIFIVTAKVDEKS